MWSVSVLAELVEGIAADEGGGLEKVLVVQRVVEASKVDVADGVFELSHTQLESVFHKGSHSFQLFLSGSIVPLALESSEKDLLRSFL